MKNQRKKSLPFLLSLAVHATLAALLFFSPKFDTANLHRHRTEVELLDPEQLLKKALPPPKDPLNGQIVEQDEKALNDELDKHSKFLSRHNQKVVHETQAAVHGKYRNTDSSAGPRTPERKAGKVVENKRGKEGPKDQPIERKAEADHTKILTADDGIAGLKSKKIKDLMPSFKPMPPSADAESLAQGGGAGPSATDDRLKNVATGMQTLLSTREFVYYSYYQRIKDKLRQYWEPKIKEKMERIVRQGRTIASNTDRITRIVIVLDKTGTLVRVQIVGPSGVNDLDDAAVEAFRAAAPFPNPPKGIVDSDGTIKIRWDFILEANSSDGLMQAIRMAHFEG